MRGKRLWKVFFLLGILALCVAAGTAGLHSGRTQKTCTVALIVKSTDSAFWKSVFAGANAAGTEYNVKLTMQGPRTEEDYVTQNKMILQAIEDGVDAIVFSAVDYLANAAAIEQAAGQGIKIVVIDSDVNAEGVSCRIGTDNHAAGRMAGEAALSAPEEELHIGIVNYDVNSANGQQRERGFREAVGADSRVTFIKTINVLSTTEDARKGTKELLAEHPEINVLTTFNEWTSLGVGWAIRDLGMQDEITVVAFDSNVVSVGMMETGEVDALIVQNPYAMGYLGVEAAWQLVSGLKMPQPRIDTETTLVNRSNMFSEECQKILFPVE